MKKGLFTYENGLVTVMALTFGVLFFDRLALNYLVPFVAKDLSLNNTQIGLLAGGLSLAWAFSSYYTTAWSESRNKNKLTVVVAIFIFSICSFGSGMAIGFGTLLIARIIMGFAEGPIIPFAQIFVERESSPNRLGINVGILQAVGGALFGSILAPVILIQIAENMGWRTAFYIAGVPGLIMGLIVFFYLRPSTAESRGVKKDTVLPSKKYGNIIISSGARCWPVVYLVGGLPPFHLSPNTLRYTGYVCREHAKDHGSSGCSDAFILLVFPRNFRQKSVEKNP